jgi:YidC/Oxa1 family membrane protein insertase
MEKRFVLAFVLSILILIGWTLVSKRLFPPPPAPAQSEQAEPAAPAAESKDAAEPAPALPPTSAPAVTATAEQEVRLETELADIVLTNKGGRVRSWRLKKFQSAGNAVDFVSAAARRDDVLPLSLAFDDRATLPEINGALFTVQRDDEPSGVTRVRFHWSDGSGSEVEKVLVFGVREPLVDISVHAIDRGRAVVPRICLGPGLELEDPKHLSNAYYNGQAVVYDGTQVLRISKRKIDTPVILPELAGLRWAGLEDQYFTALVIPGGARGAVTIARWPQSALARAGKAAPEDLATAPVMSVSMPDGRTQLFVGPKNFGLLSSLGHDLEKAVWFSSYTAIYVFAKPIFLALRFVHDHWVPNYGVAIILLTVGLRILLFPLNQFSMVKMRRTAGEMQRIQPKLKALQAKYKKNKDSESRAKLNAETMELYKREGVNPFGGVSGCLPLLMQMPILWAFYDVLTATVELRGAPFFGWIRDLTHPDAFWITPILMGATMFVQQKMTPTANVDPQQQRMMMFMPVIFTVMFVALPSGLVLYYFVNNLLGIGQQWLVNRHIARLEAAPSKA